MRILSQRGKWGGVTASTGRFSGQAVYDSFLDERLLYCLRPGNRSRFSHASETLERPHSEPLPTHLGSV